MLTLTVGRWLVVNHKQDNYASTALTLVNVTNTTGLLGGEKEKEMPVFVYIVYTHFTIASHNCGIIHTRFRGFVWWRKNRRGVAEQ